MTLSGPKRLSWWVALIVWGGVIVGLIGIVGYLVPIAALSGFAFWLLAIGWLLLAIAAAVGFLKLYR